MLTLLLGVVIGLFVEDKFKVWDKAVTRIKAWINTQSNDQ